MLYKSALKEQSGNLKMFYDGKTYSIPYSVVGEEWVLEKYRALVLNVQPNIKTKGLLKPKGMWRLWIDRENLFPVKMQLLFVLGSVKAVLEEVKGDRELLKRILL